MSTNRYISFLNQFGPLEKRSMFGGTGLFRHNSMFALLAQGRLFIRGSCVLDDEFLALGCEKFRHIKKQTTATVNYYDVTDLYRAEKACLDDLIHRSIEYAVASRCRQNQGEVKRLRDMPNMHFRLERMVKKAGIKDVATFVDLGAPKVFNKVRDIYGNDLDVSLLWKFAGAIEGVHWELLQEPRKRQLLDSCRQ
ncbi:TfoX/Sxy family DNA transformation protein [Vibrio sp. H11]|uniref:TfoX/Sxy family DNA transformation protein n=1 Tax=Vibrio sp. H11 TaxID=2565928 RepID=UPI0010A618EE|nr:TfoX/Sxy family DNA transformation protein [Vibrio sp. H11]